MSSRPSLAAAVLLIFLMGCAGGGPTPTAEQPDADAAASANADTAADCSSVTVRASHHITGESAADRGLEVMADELAERTDGRLTLEIFSDAQLGGLAEMPDNLRSGAIEMALVDSGTLSQFEPELGVFDLPYLFSSMDEFTELMDGEVGETVNERIRTDVGVVPLYWSAVGLRSMFFVDRGCEPRTIWQG